jgi:biopolymer transport protein ExbD/biopolymer transport protein TolR
MLVLLVIFMVTAPLMTRSLKLDLPRVDAASATLTPKYLAVALDAAGQLYLGEERTTAAQLAERAKAAAAVSPDTEVHLRADRAAPYGRVAELIGLVQKAGLNRIAFVIEPTPRD